MSLKVSRLQEVLTYRFKKKIDLATSVGNERLDEQKMEQINMLRFYVFIPNDKSWCFVFDVKTLRLFVT